MNKTSSQEKLSHILQADDAIEFAKLQVLIAKNSLVVAQQNELVDELQEVFEQLMEIEGAVEVVRDFFMKIPSR